MAFNMLNMYYKNTSQDDILVKEKLQTSIKVACKMLYMQVSLGLLTASTWSGRSMWAIVLHLIEGGHYYYASSYAS
jgi:hypothetical protein